MTTLTWAALGVAAVLAPTVPRPARRARSLALRGRLGSHDRGEPTGHADAGSRAAGAIAGLAAVSLVAAGCLAGGAVLGAAAAVAVATGGWLATRAVRR